MLCSLPSNVTSSRCDLSSSSAFFNRRRASSAPRTDLHSPDHREQQLFSLPPDTHRSAPHISHAYLTEQTSLTSLRLLLIQSVEAISFVLLLIDYQISDIIAACDGETQTKLLELRYMELLITPKGRDVARGLVSAVINQQIGRQLSVSSR